LKEEFEALDQLVEIEPKHYNAWSHRLFLLNRFKHSTIEEMEFAAKYIELDVRNNSAWSYRRRCITDFLQDREFVEREIEYCLSKISLAPSNESPWVYLRSLPGWDKSSAVRQQCLKVCAIDKGDRTSLQSIRDAVDTAVALHEANAENTEARQLLQELVTDDITRQNSLRLKLASFSR
jgi:protein farnesyltransferase/geranylgeranyltransferase type-1 subunit alpha